MKNTFIEYYQVINCSVSGDSFFELQRSPKNNKLIDNFFILMEKRYGYIFSKDTLWDYLIYLFSRYEGLQTRMGVNNIQLNWITGKAAFDKWDNKPDSWKYWSNKCVLKYKIIRPLEIKDVEGEFFYKKRERLRFYQSPRGVVHCADLLLFDKECKDCLKCNSYNICKDAVLKV